MGTGQRWSQVCLHRFFRSLSYAPTVHQRRRLSAVTSQKCRMPSSAQSRFQNALQMHLNAFPLPTGNRGFSPSRGTIRHGFPLQPLAPSLLSLKPELRDEIHPDLEASFPAELARPGRQLQRAQKPCAEEYRDGLHHGPTAGSTDASRIPSGIMPCHDLSIESLAFQSSVETAAADQLAMVH